MSTSKNKFRQYLFAGSPLIIIGLFINPWLISWLLNSNFSQTIFAGLLALSIILIVTGWGIIYKRNDFFAWITEKYKDTALILLNLILLFGLINFILDFFIDKPHNPSPDVSYFFYAPSDLMHDSIQFMRNIYPGKTDKEINELLLLKSPYANHPVLEFQEKVQESKSYNVGFEGIRFDNKVMKSNAQSLINGAVWVFGGSTTFGQGVNDNETITANLNKLDPAHTYINFGVHAYHQSNEIEKMLLLLKKGYLPSKVIFIDGLNDIIRMTETNFHPLETPALAKSAYTSDYNIATKEKDNSILMKLPAIRFIRAHIGQEKGLQHINNLPLNKYDDVYDPGNLYNMNPRQHYFASIERSPYKQIDTTGLNYIVWKLSELYTANYHFLQKISDAFGFEFSIYYQPIGVLSNNNPFWKDKSNYFNSPLYKNFEYIVPIVRAKFPIWNFQSFYDISNVQDSCADCYVDLTHYNPRLNQLIAEAILKNEGFLKINKAVPEMSEVVMNK